MSQNIFLKDFVRNVIKKSDFVKKIQRKINVQSQNIVCLTTIFGSLLNGLGKRFQISQFVPSEARPKAERSLGTWFENEKNGQKKKVRRRRLRRRRFLYPTKWFEKISQIKTFFQKSLNFLLLFHVFFVAFLFVSHS